MSFMERGADLTYLSAFPEEAEVLYPPLTFLRPTGSRESVTVDGMEFDIVEVAPTIGS